MKKLLAEIRALQSKKTEIMKKVNATEDIATLRSINLDLEEINQDIEFKRNKLDDMLVSQAQEDEYRSNVSSEVLKRHVQPVGQFNVLGTYMIGNQATNMNQRSEVIVSDKNDIFASPEYRSAFYKTLLGQDLEDGEKEVYVRAMSIAKAERRDAFSTITSAAAVVPTTTLNEVIAKARLMGGLIGNCRNFAIPTNLTVPIATPSGKAGWHVEGSSVTAEDAAAGIAKVSFGAYEILKVFSLSAAAQAMSISAFENYITEELNASVMQTIADSLVNGAGGGTQGTGVLSGITWDETNSFTFAKTGNMLFTDFTNMVAKLKRGYAAGAKWAMNNATLYNQAYAMTDANGRPILVNDPKVEGIGFILGLPVIVDDNLPNDVVILGNFMYMGYNIPQGIMIEVSRESSFKSGLIDYRALAIADTKPLVTEAFVKLSRATV